MGFTEVASLDADVTVALGKINKETGKPYPKSAEGYYLGSRKVESARGDSYLHFLQTSKGNLGIWGTTDLNRKIGAVKPGTMVRINSTGKKPTPNGDMYTYKVEQDSSNIIDVTAEDTGYAAENVDEEYDNANGLGDEDFAQASQLSALEKRAEVDRLLKTRSASKKN
jgi:hypothetical protein